MTPTSGQSANGVPRWFVNNFMTTMRQRLAWAMNPDRRRNIDIECGYPEGYIPPQMYQDLWDREPVAARVVEVLPMESWAVQPGVYESEDSAAATPFEQAWDGLPRMLGGEEDYYQDEDGSTVWEILLRADVLSGIGGYGVILLGLDDGDDLGQPVKPSASRKLLYIRCFPESLAQITAYEDDPKSRRFGQPSKYLLTFNDPREGQAGAGVVTSTREVHWSRVVHVADNVSTSEVYGIPRMRQVLNPILDIRKIRGGSAEMYWLGAFGGHSFETHPELGGDVEVDAQQMKDMYEEWRNGLQRGLFTKGFHVNSLSPQVADPTNALNVHMEAICVKLAIPRRIFMGSERGELASSQDAATWAKRMRHRQKYHITPRVIRPFVNRLIAVGVLPKPKGFSVWWSDLQTATETDKADVALKKTTALSAYVAGGVESIVGPLDYLTRIIGLTEEEATAVLENAKQAADDMAMMTPGVTTEAPKTAETDFGSDSATDGIPGASSATEDALS